MLITTTAFAQEEGKATPEERAAKKTEKLAEIVDLSESQVTEISAINKENILAIQAIKQNEGLSEEDKEEQVKALKKSWHESVEAQLTEEQQEKLKAHHEAKREERKNRTPEEIAADKTEKMKKFLGLSEKQEADVLALNLKVAQKIQAIRDNEEFTKEKKKEFVEGNMNDFKTVLKTILTEEQFKKFEAKEAERKAMHDERHQHDLEGDQE